MRALFQLSDYQTAGFAQTNSEHENFKQIALNKTVLQRHETYAESTQIEAARRCEGQFCDPTAYWPQVLVVTTIEK
jgi:hypothetical protein